MCPSLSIEYTLQRIWRSFQKGIRGGKLTVILIQVFVLVISWHCHDKKITILAHYFNTGRYIEFLNILSSLFLFRILLHTFRKTAQKLHFMNCKRSKTPEQKQSETKQKVQEFGVSPSVNTNVLDCI